VSFCVTYYSPVLSISHLLLYIPRQWISSDKLIHKERDVVHPPVVVLFLEAFSHISRVNVSTSAISIDCYHVSHLCAKPSEQLGASERAMSNVRENILTIDQLIFTRHGLRSGAFNIAMFHIIFLALIQLLKMTSLTCY